MTAVTEGGKGLARMATTLEPSLAQLQQINDPTGTLSGQWSKCPRPDHAERYYSREFMEREWRNMWPNVWLLAGLASDVAEPGDYLKFDLGHESFIVTRGEDGNLNAFYNVCAHRGSPLVQDDFGYARRFSCPVHSWEYGLDGANVLVPDSETFRPEVLCNNLDLTKVRVETLAGLVFVSMNAVIEPVRDWFGPVADLLDTFGIGQRRPVHHQQSVWRSNWKNCFDVFAEIYHLQGVHPQTLAWMQDTSPIDLYPRGMSTQYPRHGKPAARYRDQATVNPALADMLRAARIDPEHFTGGAQDVRPAIQAAKREHARADGIDTSQVSDDQMMDVMVLNLFPNVQISHQFEATYLIRFLPDAHEPGLFIYDSMTVVPLDESGKMHIPDWLPALDLDTEERPEIERVPLGGHLDLGELLNQDTVIVPHLQQGIQSRGFRGPLWSEQEVRLRHFHAELDRYVYGNE